MTEDKDLGFHYHESEITLNFCLGKKFEGGELYFRGLLEDEQTHGELFLYSHIPCVGLLHIGKHRHGALPIKSGERYNLIVWYRSTKIRKQYEMERSVCSHCGGYHDNNNNNNNDDHHH